MLELEDAVEAPQCCHSSPGCAPEPRFAVAENLCRVVSNQWVNDEYKHLIVEAPEVALRAQPGQFFHLACPPDQNGAALLRRPMSLYRVSPHEGTIEFLYKVQGLGTRGLARLRAGETLDALGPVGRGFAVPASAGHILLLARGVGLATLTPLADWARSEGVSVTAVLSARSEGLVMSADYLREAGAKVLIVTDEDGTSQVDYVEALIRSTHAARRLDYVATCGSNRLLQLLQRISADLDVPGQIALEQHMGCALGACFACVRPFRKQADTQDLTYRRVCWEGPVFDLQETASW